MPFITPWEGLYSMIMTKRLGRPMLCGTAWCAWSQCGEENDKVGVYQRRARRKGTIIGGEVLMQSKENFVMKHTWPVNPQTETQQAWRATFADAVLAWQALTDEERAWYRKRGTKLRRNGYAIFISTYLKSH